MLIFIPLELFATVRMQQTLDFLYNGLNIKISEPLSDASTRYPRRLSGIGLEDGLFNETR